MNHPAPKPPGEPVVSLSTRVAPEVMALLDAAVAELGCTVRAAVEHAIKFTYGGGHQDPQEAEAARELLKTETKAAYLAAVNHLFDLLALPAEEKAENHRELVMAANNKCGRTRLEMIKAWEEE